MNGSDEIAGRVEFDRWRAKNPSVGYDWADFSDAEKQRWVDKAKQAQQVRDAGQR